MGSGFLVDASLKPLRGAGRKFLRWGVAGSGVLEVMLEGGTRASRWGVAESGANIRSGSRRIIVVG